MVGKAGRPAGLNVGVTGVDRWRRDDEVHLPEGKRTTPFFLPETRPLDAILRRETLDERLARDVVPSELNPDLMEPPVLTATRISLRDKLAQAAGNAPGKARQDIMAGVMQLETEVALDEEIREAIAALLKG